jgi:hypothetical protein
MKTPSGKKSFWVIKASNSKSFYEIDKYGDYVEIKVKNGYARHLILPGNDLIQLIPAKMNMKYGELETQ